MITGLTKGPLWALFLFALPAPKPLGVGGCGCRLSKWFVSLLMGTQSQSSLGRGAWRCARPTKQTASHHAWDECG